MTTSFRKHFLSALAALSMGAAALGAHAQQTTAPNPGQDSAGAGRHAHAVRPDATPEQRAAFAARRAEFAAKRTARLHDALKITPAQENAWNAFVASMKPAARGERPDRTAVAGLSAPERMARHIERQKQRTAAMEGRLEAMNSFYALLTPEQKKTFDDKAARLQGGFGKHRGGWQQRGGDSARG
jgi:Spy/CpxP family protein refolding chaperone